jgi:hypothetical protein
VAKTTLALPTSPGECDGGQKPDTMTLEDGTKDNITDLEQLGWGLVMGMGERMGKRSNYMVAVLGRLCCERIGSII